MKYSLIIAFLFCFNCSQSQIKVNESKEIEIKKEKNGIRVDAPKGVHQYAFRIGEWETAYKSLISRTEWKSGTGKYKFYVSENGLSFIEEALNKNNEIESVTTFNYDETSDSWKNSYRDSKTGKIVEYTSKYVDGIMVETIIREDSRNNNTYTILADNVIIYTAIRTYTYGFKLVNHVGIATKKLDQSADN